jgi:hypothetical protein
MPHRKKLASVGAANQVFFVATKSAGTAPTASASGKLAARTVTQIKVLVLSEPLHKFRRFLISLSEY